MHCRVQSLYGVVDKGDQIMCYYNTPRKTIRWYLKVFFHCVNVCAWNASFYIILKSRPYVFETQSSMNLLKRPILIRNKILLLLQMDHLRVSQ